MSLLIPRAQQLAQQPSTPRTLTSKRYADISVTTSVNKNMIDFYDSYPTSEVNDNFMTRWAMYGNTPLDDRVKAEFYPALRAKIAGGGELEAANKLLNWVQTAFEYEYDEVVWGHDRAFFAEETLYYPYCDCEDRAILYTKARARPAGPEDHTGLLPGHLYLRRRLRRPSGGRLHPPRRETIRRHRPDLYRGQCGNDHAGNGQQSGKRHPPEIVPSEIKKLKKAIGQAKKPQQRINERKRNKPNNDRETEAQGQVGAITWW